MNRSRIAIDGKTYNSVDDMPKEVRRDYDEAMRGTNQTNPAQGRVESLANPFADGDHNGAPDIMENGKVINITGGMKFVANGQTYGRSRRRRARNTTRPWAPWSGIRTACLISWKV